MVCPNRLMLERYIGDPQCPSKPLIADHIANCRACRGIIRQIEEDSKHMGKILYSFKAPADLTVDSIRTLSSVKTEMKAHQVSLIKKKSPYIAAAITLLVAVVLATTPAFAYVKSFFNRDEVTDMGLLQAYQVGISSNPNVSISDKGYSLKIDEMIADKTRISLALQIVNEHDKDRNLDTMLQLGTQNKIFVKDSDGHTIGEFSDIGKTDDFYYLECPLPIENDSSKLYIEGTIHQLVDPKSNQVIKGDWGFERRVDLTKAIDNTTIRELNQTTQLADQIEATFKRVIYTPAGARLEVTTTSEAPNKQIKELYFHIKNQDGRIIDQSSPNKIGLMTNVFSTSMRANSSNSVEWTYLYKYLPQDQDLRFEFDGYRVTEPLNDSVRFDPNDLSKPIVFDSQGDQLILTGVHQDGTRTEIDIQGKFINHFANDEWVLEDSTGKETKLKFEGSYMEEKEIQLNSDSKFIANSVIDMSGDWVLKRKVIDRIVLK